MADCPTCQGRGFLSEPLAIVPGAFRRQDANSLHPCPRCQEEHPDYVPPTPGDYGTCPHHNAPYIKFKTGRIGHQAGVKDNPLWCMKGCHPPEKQLIAYWEKIADEGFEHSRGRVWCHAHRQWENKDDPIDYPCSWAWREHYAQQGLGPQYPDPGPTEHERAMGQHIAAIDRPFYAWPQLEPLAVVHRWAIPASREGASGPRLEQGEGGTDPQLAPGKPVKKSLPKPAPQPHGIDLG